LLPVLEPGEFPHALRRLHRSPLLAAGAARFEAICRAFYERVSGETLGMPRPEGAPSRSTVNIADRHTDEFELEFQTGTVFEGSGSLTLRC
jgi:hypothetical protein